MKKNKTKSFITILNVSLMFLLASIGFQTVEKVLGTYKEPVIVESKAEKDHTQERNTLLSSDSALQSYRAVWERNLFKTAQKALSSPQEQIGLANLVEADKTSGLKLIGTVLSDNSKIKSAIIEYHKDQNIYHEGDTAGSYVIKKILRNNVIVTTENGDRLLALKSDYTDPGKIVLASSSQAAPKAYSRNRIGGRFKTVELPRQEIMAVFNDIDQLISKVGTRPHNSGRLTGFKINSVPEKSILYRIGLRSHDSILAFNDEPIKGENRAFEFLKQISEGKKVTIKYRRRNRISRIELNLI
jgi:type II secretion system protein C